MSTRKHNKNTGKQSLETRSKNALKIRIYHNNQTVLLILENKV